MFNTVYLESTAGATVTFFLNDKVFYLTNFRGNRRSALYYFYLCALQVPLTFQDGLHWHDTCPLSKAFDSPLRYVSELFLLAGSQFAADAHFSYGVCSDLHRELAIHSRMTITGKGMFAGVRRTYQGQLCVSQDALLTSISYCEESRRVFHCTNTNSTNNKAEEVPA
jgi:hypothetical protein